MEKLNHAPASHKLFRRHAGSFFFIKYTFRLKRHLQNNTGVDTIVIADAIFIFRTLVYPLIRNENPKNLIPKTSILLNAWIKLNKEEKTLLKKFCTFNFYISC